MKIVTAIEFFGHEYQREGGYGIDNNYYKMMKIWIHRLNMHASECDIEFLYINKEMDGQANVLFYKDFENFLRRYPNLNINIVKMDKPSFDYTPSGRRHMLKHQHFHNNKLAILDRKPPFIWMDVDVYLFHPLKEFYKHLGNHPFVGTGHGSSTRGEKNKVQAGLYILNKSGYIDIDIGVEECLRGAKGDEHACHDQGIINGFFRKTGLNPFVFEGHEYWNWHGMRVKFHKDGGDEFVRCTNTDDEDVKACHFWGLQKPWRYEPTKDFWEDSTRRIV